MNYIYIIYDTVADEENAVIMAKNDKDAVRQLVYCGYFKVNRLKDTALYNTGLTIKDKEGSVENNFDLPYEVGIEDELKKLSIEMETKAEEKDPKEMATELKEKAKEVEKNV